MKHAFFLLFLCVVTIFSNTVEQTTVETIKKHLSAKEFDTAAKTANTFLKTNGKSKAAEDVVPLFIEALVQLHEYRKIQKLIKTFERKYPQSDNLPRIYYLSGIAEANQGNFINAITEFNRGLSVNGEKASKNDLLIRTNIEKIAEHHLSPQEIKTLLSKSLSTDVRQILENYSTKSSQATGTIHVSSIPRRATQNTIGIMVPLSGKDKELGKTALNTVQLVLESYEKTTGTKMNLRIYDTEGNAVIAAMRTRELIQDGVTTVIGPLMSNTATVTAAMLIEHPEIIMITPTATDDGIAALGNNIFQINITMRALAEKIAQYAVEDLGIKQFTILAPLNEYGKVMTVYFSNHVKKLGATIDVTEYFTPGSADHRKQFNQLREQFTSLRWKDDSLGTHNTKARKSYLADSTISLGGLFLPVNSVDYAIQLASQVPFHKIQAQILGSNGWDNTALLLNGGSAIQNSIFSTGQKADRSSSAWIDFITTYKKQYGTEPNYVVAPLVHDAISVLLLAYEGSSTTRDIIVNLNNIVNYPGLSSEISLKNNTGVNGGSVVMKVSGKTFVRVK